jgi:hypothetical protein
MYSTLGSGTKKQRRQVTILVWLSDTMRQVVYGIRRMVTQGIDRHTV